MLPSFLFSLSLFPVPPYQEESLSKNGEFARKRSIGPHVIDLSSAGLRIRYAAQSMAGVYPNDPDKENQDDYVVYENLDGGNREHFFGVFDGHGKDGAGCAQFVQNNIIDCFLESYHRNKDNKKALRQVSGARAARSIEPVANTKAQLSSFASWHSPPP